jgi:hypothetical protein
MKAEALDRPVVTITVASMVVVYEAYHAKETPIPLLLRGNGGILLMLG